MLVMTDCAQVELGTRAILAVGGADRRSFLQGLISNDINKASEARAIHAAFLTAQGRFLSAFSIVALGEELLLETEAATLEDLRKRLTMYRLRSKVTLEPMGDWAVLALIGSDAAAAAGLPAEPGAAAAFLDGIAFVDPRTAALGVRLLLPRASVPALAARGWRVAAPAEYEALRLRLGVPEGRQRRLRRGEARDRHAVGRAGDVVEPDASRRNDRGRVAAMLAADAELDVLARGAAALGRDLHQLADAFLVEETKGSFSRCPSRHRRQELARHRRATGRRSSASGRWCRRRRTRRLGDLARAQRRARQLDHRADAVVDVTPALGEHLCARRDERRASGSRARACVATSGIMISAPAPCRSLATSTAASKMARACIS
jgi:hypothetical protein